MKSLALFALLGLTPLALTADCASTDADGDGFTLEGGDCDDTNAQTFPGAPEVCGDGVDQSCDGIADEGCLPPEFAFNARESALFIAGQSSDIGGHPTDSYEDGITFSDLSAFDEELGDGAGYFGSEALQVSILGDGSIYVLGEAHARAQDDAGYGIGEATGESAFYLEFELMQAAAVSVRLRAREARGSDGGVPETSIRLSHEGEAVFALSPTGSSQSEEVDGVFPLEAGRYVLFGAANAYVDLGGGGDAYPSANSSFEIALDIQ